MLKDWSKTMEIIPSKLIDALSNQLGRPIVDVNKDDMLKEDIGFDSLTLIGLLTDIEERFGFEFDISDLDPSRLLRISDLVALINKMKVAL